MTISEKVAKIYEVVAKPRELNFGTIVEGKGFRGRFAGSRFDAMEDYYFNGLYIEKIDESFKEIGEPVMIGDVLDWYEKHRMGENLLETRETVSLIIADWKQKRGPIDAQSKECIDFIYSLVKDA